MKLSFIFLPLLILIFLALNLPHLLEFTPIWPDEGWIADVALNILKTGQPRTEIWGNMIPGAMQQVLWYPPLFFYLLAFWFKVFGFSIVSQRLMSLVISSIFITIFFVFSQALIRRETSRISIIKVYLLAFLGSLLLIIDPIFLKSSTIGRPEVLVLFLVSCSGMVIFKALDKKTKNKLRIPLLIAGGILSGISIMVHFLAVIFLLAFVIYLAVSSKKFYLEKSFYFFLISALMPAIVWAIIILPDLHILIRQLEVFVLDRSLSPRWFDIVFSSQTVAIKIIFLIYLIITLMVAVITFLTKKSYLLLISLILLASWLIAYFGKVEWYSVYITPPIYIALILFLIYAIKNKKSLIFKDLKFSVLTMLSILFIIDLNNYIGINSYIADKSYLEFAKNVKSSIPNGKTVFLHSIPDVYFAFQPDENYKIYEDPFFKTETEDFLKRLKRLDYVVINMPLFNPSTNSLFREYLLKNAEEPLVINGGGYSVFVYEFKYKD